MNRPSSNEAYSGLEGDIVLTIQYSIEENIEHLVVWQ